MRVLIILVFSALLVANATGQDIHFSQYSATPLILNPAFAGHINEDLRTGVVYRNQGAAISSPYQTFEASADMVIKPDFLGENSSGIGGYLYHDNAGGILKKTGLYAVVSFHKGLNRLQTLVGSLGFSIGVVNRSIDLSKLTFGSQWNGIYFDPAIPSGENIRESSFFYLDLNVGALVSYRFRNNSNIFTGLSMSHLNQPNETFYNGSSHLDWKWIYHGNAVIFLPKEWQLEPGIMFINMNGLSELTLGTNVLFGTRDMHVIAGFWYRTERDFIPMAGINYKRFRLLFSYDLTISPLKEANNRNGGFEISLSGTFNTRKVSCESFRF